MRTLPNSTPAYWYPAGVQKAVHDSIVISFKSVKAAVRRVRLLEISLRTNIRPTGACDQVEETCTYNTQQRPIQPVLQVGWSFLKKRKLSEDVRPKERFELTKRKRWFLPRLRMSRQSCLHRPCCIHHPSLVHQEVRWGYRSLESSRWARGKSNRMKNREIQHSCLRKISQINVIRYSVSTLENSRPAYWYPLGVQKAMQDSMVMLFTSVNAAVRKVRLTVESLIISNYMSFHHPRKRQNIYEREASNGFPTCGKSRGTLACF